MATPTYTPIASITLDSSASSVEFSSIPQDYRDLVLVINGTSSSNSQIRLEMNSDTGQNYPAVRMYGSNIANSQTFNYTGGMYMGQMGTLVQNAVIQIMDYSATDKHTAVLGRPNYTTDGATTGLSVEAVAGRWADTSAVTEIKVFQSTFQAGTTFALWGIAA